MQSRPHAREALSPREREIVWLVARGWSNAAIAEALVLSSRTVEAHLRHVYGRVLPLTDESVNRRVLLARHWLDHEAQAPAPTALVA